MNVRRIIASATAALTTSVLGATLLATTVVSAPPEVTDTATAVAAGSSPNVLVVVTDDMRWDELRWMPNVRRFVQDRGLNWRNSFAPTPLCCPNRASFLTGQYAHNHQVWWHDAPWGYGAFDDSNTMASSLQRAGYQTGYVGKYLNRYGIDRPRVNPGANPATYVPHGWNQWRGTPDATGLRERDRRAGGTYRYWDMTVNVNGTLKGHQGAYGSKVVADESIKVINQLTATGRPWYLQVNSVAPHHAKREKGDPYLPTPARPRWVKGKFNAAIPRGAGVPPSGEPEADISDKEPGTASLPPLTDADRNALRAVTRQRAEALFVLDGQLGRVFNRLAATGQLGSTIIAFTSDNGYLIGEHRWRHGKNVAYEASYRVPLLMAGPGIPRGDRVAPVSTVDLTATIADWTGAHVAGTDGRSLASDIGSSQGWTRAMLFEARNGGAPASPAFDGSRTIMGIRTARYAYFRHSNGGVELFDMANDPNQLESVARSSEYAAVRDALEGVLTSMKDCRGSGCWVDLPGGLAEPEGSTRWITDNQERAKVAYYGF